MPTYTKPTGNSGVMEIRDDGREFVELWLTANNTSLIKALPWTYILNGVQQPWKTTEFARGGYGQKLGMVRVTSGQTFTFVLGETGDSEVGGPTEFDVYLTRAQVLGSVRIKVGQQHVSAIPYINVNGVWRQLEPWAKDAGVWRQTT